MAAMVTGLVTARVFAGGAAQRGRPRQPDAAAAAAVDGGATMASSSPAMAVSCGWRRPPLPGWRRRCFDAAPNSSRRGNPIPVVETAWKIGKDAVEAGTTLVPSSVPRPIARIGVTFVALSVALFFLKSVISTAFFVLAMMGIIYFSFLVMNPKEGSRIDEGANSSEDPVEEARRIMEKYK